MYSDDEEVAFGGSTTRRDSPSPDARGSHRRPSHRGAEHDRRSRSRSRGKGKSSKGGGKGSSRPRTTGRELPRLHSIHQASVVSIQSYGAFVRLGDGSTYKDGLLHVSRISASGRIEAVTDVLSEGDPIWVKVVEVNEDAQKHSVDMRHVRQKDGEDLDPTNTQVDTGRGSKGGGKGPEPIRIGAVQAVNCSRCGARGHMARECFSQGGSNYALVDDVPEEPTGAERPSEVVPGVDPKIVKAALKAYMERKAIGGKEGKSDKKEKKEQKKAAKSEKKQEKKRKKEEKKRKKKEKKVKKKEQKDKKGSKDKKESKDKKGDAPAKGKGKAEEGSIAAALAGVSSSSSSSSSSS